MIGALSSATQSQPAAPSAATSTSAPPAKSAAGGEDSVHLSEAAQKASACSGQ